MKERIASTIKKAVITLQRKKELKKFKIPEVLVEYPREENHGDYSSNVALQIGKITRKKTMEVAKIISLELQAQSKKVFGKIEEAEPGFINFFLSKGYLQKQVEEILRAEDKFGSLKIGKGQKVNVEFISANPTGPLTLGNGRGGFCGDVLSNILEKAGFKVTREYYINDMGSQIRALGYSVLDGSEAVYQGEYIKKLKKKIKPDCRRAGIEDPQKTGRKAAEQILKDMIKPIIKKMGIKFDVWFSEKSLYGKKQTDKVLRKLKRKKLVFEKEKALWFKSAKFGDDKDRVLIRADKEPAYFLSDIAYLENKFNRGFEKLVFFWGADHHGYIKRMKAAAEALGYSKKQIDFVILQLVRLFKWGKQIRMSKRRGIYITLDELIDEIGLDVVRFFFLTRSPGTHLNFDLDLAKEKSEKNPVFYIQYAYARICSILRKLKMKSAKPRVTTENLKLLKHPLELELIKQLIRFPEIIEDTVYDYQVQRIPQYTIDLAAVFHQFYRGCRVLGKNKELTQARLSLIKATKIVLKNSLDLMGISAPEKM